MQNCFSKMHRLTPTLKIVHGSRDLQDKVQAYQAAPNGRSSWQAGCAALGRGLALSESWSRKSLPNS